MVIMSKKLSSKTFQKPCYEQILRLTSILAPKGFCYPQISILNLLGIIGLKRYFSLDWTKIKFQFAFWGALNMLTKNLSKPPQHGRIWIELMLSIFCFSVDTVVATRKCKSLCKWWPSCSCPTSLEFGVSSLSRPFLWTFKQFFVCRPSLRIF